MSNSNLVTTISAQGKPTSVVQDIWDYRNLVYFFTWREFKIRYKQTALGMFWVALQPLVFMGIVQLILLRRIGNDFGVEGVPSYIMVFLGFVMWQFFEGSFSGTVNGFVNSQNLYKKIYFPKIIPSVAFALSRLIDLMIGVVVLMILVLIFGYGLGWDGFDGLKWQGFALFIPVTVFMAMAAIGAGLLFGTLNVRFRDVKQVMPFIIRMGFLSTPIFWPLSIMSESIQRFLYLNPAAAGIQTMREAFFDPDKIKWGWLLMPLTVMVVVLIWGIWYFKRKENSMVDIA